MSADELVMTANIVYYATWLVAAVVALLFGWVAFWAVLGVGFAAVVALFATAFRTLKEES